MAHDLATRGVHLRADPQLRHDVSHDLFVESGLLEVFLPLGAQVVVDHASQGGAAHLHTAALGFQTQVARRTRRRRRDQRAASGGVISSEVDRHAMVVVVEHDDELEAYRRISSRVSARRSPTHTSRSTRLSCRRRAGGSRGGAGRRRTGPATPPLAARSSSSTDDGNCGSGPPPDDRDPGRVSATRPARPFTRSTRVGFRPRRRRPGTRSSTRNRGR